MSDGWASWLWTFVLEHAQGILILAELFWPFVIISPIVHALLSKQKAQDQFDLSRFNRFIRRFTIVLFVVLEVPFLAQYNASVTYALLWFGFVAICLLVWEFPEQIQYLSAFPDALIEPRVAWLVKRLRKPKGFPIQLVRGDQLKSDKARGRIGIPGSVFPCFICRKEKAYPAEYGATLIVKRKRRHVCSDCLPGLPQLKVADLRRWM